VPASSSAIDRSIATDDRSSSRMTWAIPRLGEGSLSRDLSFQAKGVGVYVTGEAIRSR
jgi:hypothetical protein